MVINQRLKFLKNILVLFVIWSVIILIPGRSQAKDADDQDQIILLNDSAAALEDTNPDLSKSLTRLADEKEKMWETKNANKDSSASPTDKINTAELQDEVNLLKASAQALQSDYPAIAKSLNQMAHDINRTIEVEN